MTTDNHDTSNRQPADAGLPLTANVQENTPASTKETNNEPIVIPDECGDTLWDEVLAQQKALDELTALAKTVSANDLPKK